LLNGVSWLYHWMIGFELINKFVEVNWFWFCRGVFCEGFKIFNESLRFDKGCYGGKYGSQLICMARVVNSYVLGGRVV
jgi:hypothetical protein